MSEGTDIPAGQSAQPPEHPPGAVAPPAGVTRGASPVAAAALAAGIVYMWAEAIFRYAFTHSPSFNSSYFILFKSRPGDVASMWLTILLIQVVVFFALAYLWRGRTHVGSLREWTIGLIVSAIAGPMLGELGTPASATISPATTDAIAWIVAGIAILLGAAALARPRFGGASAGSSTKKTDPL